MAHVLRFRKVMETDTAWVIFKALYPTIIVITVLLMAASLAAGLT